MSRTRLYRQCFPLVMLLTACSGGQQTLPQPNTPQLTNSIQSSDPARYTQTSSLQTGSLNVSGSITSVSSSGFVLQTGSLHGYVPVTTSSSTQFVGSKPYAGESVSVSGNGSWSSLQAVNVTQLGGSLSASGSITSTTSSGFTLQTGTAHGYVPVATSSTTQFVGTKPYVGETVTVSGNGSWSLVQAVSVTENGTGSNNGNVPKHITAWAFDEYNGVGAEGTTAEVREYLDYAQSGAGNSKASVDCHGSGVCKAVFYLNPNLEYSSSRCPFEPDSQVIAAASESWFVHLYGYSDSAHRVHGTYSQSCNGSTASIPVYALNGSNTSVQSYWASYIRSNAVNYDYFFMDNTHGTVVDQFYGPGGSFCGSSYCTSTQEFRSDAAVITEHAQLANAMPMPGFFNNFTFASNEPSDLSLLQSTGKFVGGICEDCVVSAGTFMRSEYLEVLNTMAKIDAIPGASFVELNHGVSTPGSSAQIAQRAVTTAMAWLGYSEGHTIVWPDLEANTQRLPVFPENSIYPSVPLESMLTGATDIQVASGVYRREFSSCYNAGTAIGPCAAIVNSNASTVVVSSSWLHQSYGHVVEMIGADIPSGGTVSLTGQSFTANATSIPAGEALLLVR